MGSAPFEVTRALTDLDERTPEYLRREIFAHGTLDMRRHAIAALKRGPNPIVALRVLKERLKVIPDD